MRRHAVKQPLVVIGDALLDRDVEGTAERLCPDAPAPVVDEREVRERPGGAGLAAFLAVRAEPDREVVLVTALGEDEVSDRLRDLLAGHVTILEMPLDRPPPQKTRIRSGDRALLRLDRGGGGTVGDGPDTAIGEALAGAGAVLVADYGQGVAANARLRAWLGQRTRRAPLVWDPHPRGPAPVPGAALATPSLAEARALAGGSAELAELRLADACGRSLARTWQCSGVAVTLGDKGALLSLGAGSPLFAPVPSDGSGMLSEAGRDVCGAGDRFATAAALALAAGALPSEAVLAAVGAAADFVAAGGAARVYPPNGMPAGFGGDGCAGGAPDGACGESASSVIARTRAAGGTVVATGGCFDLLHAGHVATLRTARALGDCLVVCLNSDASVRGLKGASRPLNTAADREAVLRSLSCVDAVEVFDETTPESVLARLRPDVWVKGGDYGGADLPESDLVSEWGGQTVVVPYVPGHSTTRITGTRQQPRGAATKAT